MAGLWLNQCGETAVNRKSFAFSVTIPRTGAWPYYTHGTPVITGDADAKNEEVVDRMYRPSGDFPADQAGGAYTFLVDRELEPGWWELEIVASVDPDPDYDFLPGFTVGFFVGYTGFSDPTMVVDWILPAAPSVVVYDGTASGIGLAESFQGPCARLVAVVRALPSLTNISSSFTVTGTWLACADCSEPI